MAEGKSQGNVRRQLSLSARPKSLDGLVGQEKAVQGIRGHFEGGVYPKAWFFAGPKGTGKTSAARILAVSYQCEHQERFGQPCRDCYRQYLANEFPIFPIPGALISTKEELRAALTGASAGVMGDGRFRVYIIDELQRASDAAQSLLLDKLEDTPDTTVFIFTTTNPYSVLEPLRSRCLCYEFKELGQPGVEKLVTRLLKRVESDLGADRLAEALGERGVGSPRLIAQAVEKYVAGLEPEEAADVSGATEVDIRSLTRAVISGDWEGASRLLLAAQKGDMRSVRLALLGYLRRALLESSEIGPRAKTIASAIMALTELKNTEDLAVAAGVAATVYKLTELFGRYRV